jgi:hypothetical protein
MAFETSDSAVVDVAEEARVRGAGHHARGFPVALGQRLVGDAVDAEGALLHHLLLGVQLAHAVRARPRAVFAADALVVVHEHDAILGTLVARARGTHRHARRVLAVQAGLGKVDGLGVRIRADLERLHAIEVGADGIGAVGLEVGERPRGAAVVPLLAARDARMAAHADVQVDDEGELGHAILIGSNFGDVSFGSSPLAA